MKSLVRPAVTDGASNIYICGGSTGSGGGAPGPALIVKLLADGTLATQATWDGGIAGAQQQFSSIVLADDSNLYTWSRFTF